MKLNNQLTELENKAISIIKNAVVKHNGVIVFADASEAFDQESPDDVLLAFKEKTLMITHKLEGENEDCYILQIMGNELDAQLSVITEYGNIYGVDLLELDTFNLTVLADFLIFHNA